MVGQRAIIETLRNQVVSDRIAHAYLFCGSRGTGKTSTAKILARAINCEHPENGDPCGKCSNCIRMENEESLDIIEIDAASNNGVDEMRNLRETVKYPPQYGKYKVYIIDEVHMLSTSAFNALLKTLEEPPAHIVFILATTEPQKLPETILSRCQRFDFGRIAVSDIQGRLKEAAEGSGAKVTPGALMVIARAAEGGMRDALSILDMCLGYGNEIDEDMVRGILGTCDQAFLFRFAHALATENTRELFSMIDQVMRNGRDPSVFIKDISYHIRTLLLAKCCPEEIGEILDLTDEDADEFRNQAEDFTVTRLMTILELMMNAESEMRFSSSQRLTLENVCLKCCLRTGESDAQALSDRIAELERKIEELNERIARGIPAAPTGAATPASPAAPAREKKTETPKKETAPAVKPAAADVQAAWKEAMNRLSKEDPRIWGLLTQGKISCEGNEIRWTPLKAEGAEYFIAPLNREEKKAEIRNILKTVTGADYAFSAGIPAAKERSQDPINSDDAYINKLYETFGKEPVDIVDKL
jgi:DNA polymerase-3 subunit gamma/tau